jgi:site-specific recombinase XerD
MTDVDLPAFVDWMRERGMSENTARVRRDALVRLSAYLRKPLREATEHDLRCWTAFVTRGRAHETERVYIGALRAFYAWASATSRSAANPARRLHPRASWELLAEARARREAAEREVEEFFVRRRHSATAL